MFQTTLLRHTPKFFSNCSNRIPLPVFLPSDRFLDKLLTYDYDLHGELIIAVGKKDKFRAPKLKIIDTHNQVKSLRKICDTHSELSEDDDINIDIYSVLSEKKTRGNYY